MRLDNLLDQVQCQGDVKVIVIDKWSEEVIANFYGEDIRQIPYSIGSKQLRNIYSGIGDHGKPCTYYELWA